jgi:hypothetical protein
MEGGMTVRETATVLGIRLGSAYSLIWAGTLKATKINDVWAVESESVAAYQVQRSARRQRILRSRSSQRRVIDVEVVAQSEMRDPEEFLRKDQPLPARGQR